MQNYFSRNIRHHRKTLIRNILPHYDYFYFVTVPALCSCWHHFRLALWVWMSFCLCLIQSRLSLQCPDILTWNLPWTFMAPGRQFFIILVTFPTFSSNHPFHFLTYCKLFSETSHRSPKTLSLTLEIHDMWTRSAQPECHDNNVSGYDWAEQCVEQMNALADKTFLFI